MYICSCTAVTESVLKEHAKDCECVEELVLKTGASDCCGTCRETVEFIFGNPHVSFENAVMKFLKTSS